MMVLDRLLVLAGNSCSIVLQHSTSGTCLSGLLQGVSEITHVKYSEEHLAISAQYMFGFCFSQSPCWQPTKAGCKNHF